MRILTVFLALVVSLVVADITGSWDTRPLQPPPRSKHGQRQLYEDTILIFGGRDPGGNTLSDAWTYNISTDRFQELKIHGTLPPPRSVASMVVVNNSHGKPMMYIWGGLLNEQPTVLYDMYEVDPATGLSNAVGTRVAGRQRHATCQVGNKMVVGFGVARGMQNDVWMFDTESYTWTNLVPVNPRDTPMEKFGLCCEAINDTAVLFFGGTNVDVSDSNDVHLFDINFRRWQHLAPADPNADQPAKRRNIGCYFDKQKNTLMISHGWSGADLVGFKDLWDFDIINRKWTVVSPEAQKVESQMLDSAFWTVMPNRKAYMFGGWGEVTTINEMWQHDMNTRENVQKYGYKLKPSARFLHCAVNIGTDLYVLFGQLKGDVLSDVWRYNTNTDDWAQIGTQMTNGGSLQLYGATCVPHGTMIFVFGGKRSVNGQDFVNDLYQIDLTDIGETVQPDTTVTVTKITPVPTTGGIPIERFQAPGVIFQEDKLVISGGKGKPPIPFSDIWIFHTRLSQWEQVARFPKPESYAYIGDYLPGARFRHNMNVMNTNALLISNGDDGNTNWEDRWLSYPEKRLTSAGDPSYYMNFSLLSWINVPPLIKADVVRTSASSINGFNATHMIVFGGTMDGDSIKTRSSMHMFNFLTTENRILPEMHIAVTESPAVFIGRKVYVFGGRKLDKGTVLDQHTSLQVFTFDQTAICAGWDDTKGACQTCPVGFKPPNCDPCPVNTYFDETAADCLPCESGRVSKRQGLARRVSCTIGVSGSSSTDEPTSEPTVSIQSKPFVPGSTPWDMYVAVFVIAGVSVGILIFLIYGVGYLQQKKRDRWITPEMQDAIQREFDEVSGKGPEGLGDKQLFVLFQRLASPDTRYTITDEWVADLVTKYDGDGSRQIEIDEFTDMIMECCMSTKSDFNVDWVRFGVEESSVPPPMKPLPPNVLEDDPEYRDILDQKIKAQTRIAFSLKSIDLFVDRHTVGSLGEAMYFKATDSGGIATIAWFLGIVLIFLTLFGTFYWDNVQEERASQPYVTLAFDVRSNVDVTLSLLGSGFDPKSQADANVLCTMFATDFLIGKDVIQYGDPLSGRTNPFLSCTYGTEKVDGKTLNLFNVTWSCRLCNLGSQTAQLQFKSSDDRSYASAVRLSVVATSGIKDQNKKESHLIVDNQQKSSTSRLVKTKGIFRGLAEEDAMSFDIDVFPTVYGPKDEVDLSNKNVTTTGYHVYVTSFKAKTVPLERFLSVNGLNVLLNFQMRGASTLMVTTREKQSIQAFLSGLVGAISGFVGACVAVMKFFDGRATSKREAELKASKKENRLQLREDHRASVKTGDEHELAMFQLEMEQARDRIPPGCPDWYLQVEKLMLAGMNFQTARGVVEAIKVLAADAQMAPRTPVIDPVEDEGGAPFGALPEK